MKVTERGAWLSTGEGHMFDASLAEAIAEYLIERGIKSAIDIGCGNGTYTKYLRSCGIDCDGYDGNPNTPQISGGLCKVADFSEPQRFGIYECALSLEVGEHIPEDYEGTFLDNLSRHAESLIIMSWAVVGQGGHTHVNERDNDYIQAEMSWRGWRRLTDDEYTIRASASNCYWFKNTIMIYVR